MLKIAGSLSQSPQVRRRAFRRSPRLPAQAAGARRQWRSQEQQLGCARHQTHQKTEPRARDQSTQR